MVLEKNGPEEQEDGAPGQGTRLKAVAFPLIACVDIEAGDELLWRYGAGYSGFRRAKNYKAGTPCSNKDPGWKQCTDDDYEGHAHRLMQDIWQDECDKPLAVSKYSVVYRQYDDDGEPAVPSSELESHRALNLPPSYHDPQRGA